MRLFAFFRLFNTQAFTALKKTKIHQKSLIFKNQALYGQALIKQLSEKGKVAVLIDEYDKPIIDYLTDIKQAEENRDILKNFYSAIKPSSAYLRFVFITGVSKFSRVSIFSDLNNLEDITIDEEYAILTGYTQDELLKYFVDYFPKLEKKYKQIYPDIKQAIRELV